jgi:hypothetical protein
VRVLEFVFFVTMTVMAVVVVVLVVILLFLRLSWGSRCIKLGMGVGVDEFAQIL